MEQIPNSSSASKEILRILSKPEVHHRIHKSLLFVPDQSSLHPPKVSVTSSFI